MAKKLAKSRRIGRLLVSLRASSRRLRRKRPPRPRRDPAVVPIFFATDRSIHPRAPAHKVDFLDGRGKRQLAYGLADVTVVSGKKLSVSRCEVRPHAQWKELVADRLQFSGTGAALVLVHGFNVSFDEAIREAAQVAFEVQLDGLVAAYSWCSEFAVRGYKADEDNVLLTAPLLRKFLVELNAAGARTIHLIAHSMGNRAVVEALRGLKETGFIGEVVFAAPDIDAEVFRETLSELQGKARRYTLYGSAQDWAIRLSKRLRKGYPRAGDGRRNIFVAEGVETVDATAVGRDLLGIRVEVGHSYFSEKYRVLADIHYVIRQVPPHERPGLRRRRSGERVYWELRRR